jgi:hypothetical protein
MSESEKEPTPMRALAMEIVGRLVEMVRAEHASPESRPVDHTKFTRRLIDSLLEEIVNVTVGDETTDEFTSFCYDNLQERLCEMVLW